MKTFRKIRYIVYVLLSVFCIWSLLPLTPFVFDTIFRVEPRYPITELTDNWTVTINEEVRDNCTLSETVTNPIGPKDVVILSTRLPVEEVPMACMEIRTMWSSLDVFLGDDLLYSYGDIQDKYSVSPELQTVPLFSGYGGKRISLVFRTNSINAFSKIAPIRIGNRRDLLSLWLHNNIRPIFYGAFLSLFGVFMLFLAVFMLRTSSKDRRIVLSSIITLLYGTFLLSHHGIYGYLLSSPRVNEWLVWISLYFLQPFIVGFLSVLWNGSSQRTLRRIARIDMGITVVMLILLFSTTGKGNLLLAILGGKILAESIYVLTLLCMDLIQAMGRNRTDGDTQEERIFKRRADRILMAGAVVTTVAGLLDVIAYMITWNNPKYDTTDGVAHMTMIGALVFSSCLLQNYFFYTVEHVNETQRNERLSGIAYSDPLTGLANRARCEQTIEAVEKSGSDYCIYCIDVNDLKRINDTYGHTQGDRLLRTFAHTLEECFQDSALIGRMGGDEFMVILTDTPRSTCQQKEVMLREAIERLNRKEMVFSYGMSCGHAFKGEKLGAQIMDIYRMADDRMYQDKRRYHSREVQRA